MDTAIDHATAAARRLLDFVAGWGDGVVDMVNGHPLHTRDIETIARLMLAALDRTADLAVHVQYGVSWTDIHGDTRIDPAPDRGTACHTADGLRAAQRRQGRVSAVQVKLRAVGPWVNDE
ncbi:hypothetical protein NDR87_30070 [Nocardia sp. CDC159]|uniref:Uncharacterized protein n=1 Tax=Nocardia pulmonis TaxID=2951408 RepID=A0A9X2EC68_9NOCA|nr:MULTISPECIES: hypothetical protein [Nocardia]MCM6777739.1 hypothetical protein [Nocardia pulmonis]MCM6790624.1 hypothetical protein [Nocardia sp. CDC159]